MFYVWKFIVGHRFDTHPPFQAEILLFFPLFLLSYYNPAPLWDLPSPFSFSSSLLFLLLFMLFFFSLLSSLFFKIFFAVALWVKGLWLNGPQRGPWTSHLLRERFLDFTQALNHSSALPLETSLAHSGSLPTVPPSLPSSCLYVILLWIQMSAASFVLQRMNVRNGHVYTAGNLLGFEVQSLFKNRRRSSCAA